MAEADWNEVEMGTTEGRMVFTVPCSWRHQLPAPPAQHDTLG